jgi:hypothetical protein
MTYHSGKEEGGSYGEDGSIVCLTNRAIIVLAVNSGI